MKTLSQPLLLLLLVFLQNSETGEPRSLPQPCSSSCGHLTNITYPFRLTTDPQPCGDHDYQISCLNNNTPTFRFHSANYFVRRIFYDRHVIRLVDPSFFPNASCGLPSHSLSAGELAYDPRFGAYASNTDTSFVRCSGNLSGEQSYRRLPCLSGNDNGAGGGLSVYVSYGTYIISGLTGTCSFLSRVPTIYQDVMNPSYESIMLLLQEGFDLGWSVECRNCLARGRSCAFTDYDTPFLYRCSSSSAADYFSALVSAFISSLSGLFLVINLIARFILAPIVIVGFLIHKYKTTNKNKNPAVEINTKFFSNSGSGSSLATRYSYSEIEAMTDQFKDKLGRGRFGTVFRGQLPDNGGLVAVRMLDDHSKFSVEDLMKEISVIARVRHNNVVRLLGFCSEGSHSALVYDYMPNGSLDKYISTRGGELKLQSLRWEQVHHIALGTAQGIRHLHEGCDVPILHLDIKPQNVMLDHEFAPKVADLGLAKLYRKRNDPLSDLQYVAPEALSDSMEAVSCKSDVYSFGMLLLGMVEGKRRAESKGKKSSSEEYFPMWVYDHLSDGGDLELQNATEMESAAARKLCVVGLWCIQKRASDRPPMTKVLEMLMDGNANNLQLPPNSLCFLQQDSAKDPPSDSSKRFLIPEFVEPSS